MKVQRNHPCPCGSEKKAKRCCHSSQAIRKARERKLTEERIARDKARKAREIEQFGRELTGEERVERARKIINQFGGLGGFLGGEDIF